MLNKFILLLWLFVQTLAYTAQAQNLPVPIETPDELPALIEDLLPVVTEEEVPLWDTGIPVVDLPPIHDKEPIYHKGKKYHKKRIGCLCKDGTYQKNTGTGACSGHGGVRHWVYGVDDDAPDLEKLSKKKSLNSKDLKRIFLDPKDSQAAFKEYVESEHTQTKRSVQEDPSTVDTEFKLYMRFFMFALIAIVLLVTVKLLVK